MVAQSINSPFEGRFVERPLSVRFRRAGDVDLWDISVAHCQELERWRSKIFADLYDRGGPEWKPGKEYDSNRFRIPAAGI